MQAFKEKVLLISFIGLFVGCFLFWLFTPKASFSDLENRPLQKKPELSFETLVNHRFAEQTELYLSDHFPFRSSWLTLKSAAEQLRLQKENNGIYKGKNHFLMEYLPPLSDVQREYWIQTLQQFDQETDVSSELILVPTSIQMYPAERPKYAPIASQKADFKTIEEALPFPMWNGIEHLAPYVSEPIYFKTDHHWTMDGAYYAYRDWAERHGVIPHEKSNYERQVVSDSFYGSFDTKGRFAFTQPDSLVFYKTKQPLNQTIELVDEQRFLTGWTDSGYLQKKDHYSYILGGVHALLRIQTVVPKEQLVAQRLLVVKDSYAHVLLPFLAEHVQELHVLDLRYYNGSVQKYLEEQAIDQVLFIYNMQSVHEASHFLYKVNY